MRDQKIYRTKVYNILIFYTNIITGEIGLKEFDHAGFAFKIKSSIKTD